VSQQRETPLNRKEDTKDKDKLDAMLTAKDEINKEDKDKQDVTPTPE